MRFVLLSCSCIYAEVAPRYLHHAQTVLTWQQVLLCRYSVEPPMLAMGAVPYSQFAEAEVALVNGGSLPFDFCVAASPKTAPDAETRGSCVVTPAHGRVRAFGREVLRLRVRHPDISEAHWSQ